MKAALLLAFLGAVAFAPAASARVGDTQEEMAHRYGSGKEIGGQVLYTSDRFAITAAFNAKGQVAMEFIGLRPDAEGKHPEITDGDCNELLHQEGRGQRWDEIAIPSNLGATKTWRRADSKVFARFIPGQQVFVVMSVDGMGGETLPGVNQIAPGQPLPTAPAP